MTWHYYVSLVGSLGTSAISLAINRSSKEMGSRIKTSGIDVVVLRIFAHLPEFLGM